MSSQSQSNTNQSAFLLLWIGVNAVGWTALTTMGRGLYVILEGIGFPVPLDIAPYIGFFIIGSVMGLMQWLVLRLRFPIAWYAWVMASAVGFGIGLWGDAWATLLDRYIIIGSPTGPLLEWDPLIGGLLLGLALGCCQSMVWRFPLRRILAWIIASMLGWSLGMFLAEVTAFLLHDFVTGDHLYTYVLVPGILAGMTTGAVLHWLWGRYGEENGRFSSPEELIKRST